jgi:hypothetical protein
MVYETIALPLSYTGKVGANWYPRFDNRASHLARQARSRIRFDDALWWHLVGCYSRSLRGGCSILLALWVLAAVGARTTAPDGSDARGARLKAANQIHVTTSLVRRHVAGLDLDGRPSFHATRAVAIPDPPTSFVHVVHREPIRPDLSVVQSHSSRGPPHG